MTLEACGYFEQRDLAQAARLYQAIMDAFPNDPVF
jgi:cytochrome c-type biogenesis protein CcmH/NrfG